MAVSERLTIDEVETWVSGQVHISEQAAQLNKDGEVSTELRSLAAQAALQGLQRYAKAQEPPLTTEQTLQRLTSSTCLGLGQLLGTLNTEELRWNNNTRNQAARAVVFAAGLHCPAVRTEGQ